jgi:heptosyltransferase-2
VLHLRPELSPLLSGAPWFDEILPLRSYHGGPGALLREVASLRRRSFDLGFCLPDSLSSALLMRMGGVRRIVAYRRFGRAALVDCPVEPPGGNRRRIMVARELHVLGLVEAVGCPPRGTHVELFVSPEEETEALAVLHRAGLDASDRLALLAPGASYGPSKLWPAERFAQVGDELVRRGATVAVVGTAGERALAARVVEAMRAHAANLAGLLGLGALKAVVRRARVLVGNDAGARHVAVAFGVASVILMGPTSLEKTPLNLERVTVLSADVACRPCYLRECPIDHRCMTRIEPEQVIEAALPALQGDAAGSSSVGALA